MDRRQLLWQMTAEQFAAFDIHLYLDTHPGDRTALRMYDNYQKAAAEYRNEFESLYGPLTAENTSSGNWDWINNPWPWEKEAN